MAVSKRSNSASARKRSTSRGGNAKKKEQEQPLNPRTTSFEWGGPVGAFCTTLALPAVVLFLNTICASNNQCAISNLWRGGGGGGGFSAASLKANFASYASDAGATLSAATQQLPEACAFELLWIAFHCAFYLLPVGQKGPGMPLRGGQGTLSYNFNAIHSLVVSLAGFFAGHYFQIIDGTRLADMFFSLLLASLIISVAFAVMLYAASFRTGGESKSGGGGGGGSVLLALGGNTGNAFYDFWVGRELNPRFGDLDFKWLFELRPGLIGWLLLAWSFVLKSAQQHGGGVAGATTNLPLLLVTCCYTIYVVDGLYVEAGCVTMMDIAYDGFGFMLCFGDLSWVPFLYTLQARYLFMFPAASAQIPRWYVALACAVFVAGYVTFRRSNSDKDRFRKDPTDARVAHLQVMRTSAGKSLIVSGWWGMCRHPNYVGDWLMVLGECMLCGYGAFVPYWQAIYFAILLVHRQMRDEEWMLQKYGREDWDAYCKRVPYRLIPKVY